MRHRILAGLIAGAAGATALNVVTYLDMATRGRASSSLPAKAAAELAKRAGVDLGVGETKQHREEGLGALMGYATGVGVGVAYGLTTTVVRFPATIAGIGLGVGAMAASDAPMTALKLTDPQKWSASEWISDAVPHLAFGIVAAVTFQLISRDAPKVAG